MCKRVHLWYSNVHMKHIPIFLEKVNPKKNHIRNQQREKGGNDKRSKPWHFTSFFWKRKRFFLEKSLFYFFFEISVFLVLVTICDRSGSRRGFGGGCSRSLSDHSRRSRSIGARWSRIAFSFSWKKTNKEEKKRNRG